MSQNRAVVPFIPPGQPVYEHHQGINIPATSSTQPRSVSSAQTQCSRPLCSDQSKLRLYQSRKKVSFHLQQKRNAQPKETNKKYQHKMTPKGSVSAPVQAGPPIPNVARLLTLSGKTGEEVASALGIDYVAMHNILHNRVPAIERWAPVFAKCTLLARKGLLKLLGYTITPTLSQANVAGPGMPTTTPAVEEAHTISTQDGVKNETSDDRPPSELPEAVPSVTSGLLGPISAASIINASQADSSKVAVDFDVGTCHNLQITENKSCFNSSRCIDAGAVHQETLISVPCDMEKTAKQVKLFEDTVLSPSMTQLLLSKLTVISLKRKAFLLSPSTDTDYDSGSIVKESTQESDVQPITNSTTLPVAGNTGAGGQLQSGTNRRNETKTETGNETMDSNSTTDKARQASTNHHRRPSDEVMELRRADPRPVGRRIFEFLSARGDNIVNQCKQCLMQGWHGWEHYKLTEDQVNEFFAGNCKEAEAVADFLLQLGLATDIRTLFSIFTR